MRERLPVRYRLGVWIAVLIAFTAFGAATGLLSAVTPPWPSTTVAGTLAGVLGASAFLALLERDLRAAPARRQTPARRSG